MTLKKMFGLKVGDVIVKVRKHYQNYDHTLIPCEPIVYTVSWKGGHEISLKENVKRSFVKDGIRYVDAHGVDNSVICESFVTLADYISGEYNKDIILDKQKWSSLEAFLLFKMENDHKKAREAEESRVKKEELARAG